MSPPVDMQQPAHKLPAKAPHQGTVTQRYLGNNDLAGVDYDDDLLSDDAQRSSGYTRDDRHDMDRMGKRQELLRDYRPHSILSFCVVLQATWEFLLISITQGLTDGGLAGLFWTYVWTFLGFSLVIASLAEMSSMSPTSGGQYHWVRLSFAVQFTFS